MTLNQYLNERVDELGKMFTIPNIIPLVVKSNISHIVVEKNWDGKWYAYPADGMYHRPAPENQITNIDFENAVLKAIIYSKTGIMPTNEVPSPSQNEGQPPVKNEELTTKSSFEQFNDILQTTFLMALAGGAVYYFFFYDKKGKKK